MKARSVGMLAAAAVVSILAATAADAAQDCALKQAASLDLIESSDGHPLVPLVVSGATRYFYLDFSPDNTSISTAFADELKLERKPVKATFGIVFSEAKALLPSLQIGALGGTNVPVLISRSVLGSNPDPRAVGVITIDLLSNFDIELALGANKLNLFSHDHCPGQVVYWANEYTTAPLSYKKSEDLHIEMQLDGKPINVGLQPRAIRSIISMRAAHEMFGLDSDSPGMEQVSGANELYRYPFNTLSSGGFTINKPEIFVYGKKTDLPCDGRSRIFGSGLIKCFGLGLGLTAKQLRLIHIYLALEENIAYITAASAHK